MHSSIVVDFAESRLWMDEVKINDYSADVQDSGAQNWQMRWKDRSECLITKYVALCTSNWRQLGSKAQRMQLWIKTTFSKYTDFSKQLSLLLQPAHLFTRDDYFHHNFN